MTSLIPPRFPVDYTGEHPDNLVANEPHSLPARRYRSIAPLHAPFFKQGLVIVDNDTQQILNAQQFRLMNIVPLPTAMAGLGKEVYDNIVITDESVSSDVSVTYQSVGGYYTVGFQTTKHLLDILYDDDRPAHWPNILEKPESFPPPPHLHDIGSAIGFEYLVAAIERLRSVILMSDSASDDVIFQYVDDKHDLLVSIMQSYIDETSAFGRHLTNINPHNLTPADIGLGNVRNYPIATLDEAIRGNLPNRYMTPSLVKAFVESYLAYHFGAADNPHNVTKAQVGLPLIQNYPLASVNDLVNAVVDDPKYVTNHVAKQYLDDYLQQHQQNIISQINQISQSVDTASANASLALAKANTDVDGLVAASQQAVVNATDAQNLAQTCNNNVLDSEQLARDLLNVYIDSYAIINWVRTTLPSIADWRDVAYGNGTFVAIAQSTSDKVAYSEDGKIWSASTLPQAANWSAITYGNGLFVTVAAGSNLAATSVDGITWALRSLATTANWHDVGYGNGRFVAVAYGSQVNYSEDGIAWTTANMPSVADWVSVTYGNNVFTAVARGSDKAAISNNGQAWSEQILPVSSEWTAIAYGNGVFVATAALSTEFATSPNGVDWTERTLPNDLGLNWQAIVYGDGKFLALATNSNKAAMSLDNGVTWSERTLQDNLQWIAGAYGENTFALIAKDSNRGAANEPLPSV